MALATYDPALGTNLDVLLSTLGCTAASSYDGVSTIVYQSVPADTPITAELQVIETVVIQYSDDTFDPGNSDDPWQENSGSNNENSNTEGGFWG
jgi:hypothetical protein